MCERVFKERPLNDSISNYYRHISQYLLPESDQKVALEMLSMSF